MKWVGVIILVIVGLLAAFVAIEYFTVEIHALPSFLPGHEALKYGHYRKRGALAALIAVVAFVVAAILAVRILRSDPAPAASAGDLLGSPPRGPAPSPEDPNTN
jgi:uncharacterized membrane protein YidH (DUF202 family)